MSSTTTTIAKRVVERKIPDGFLAATAALTHIAGNARPHFSVTGEIWDSEGWYRRGGPDGRLRACGSIHDEIRRYAVELLPVLDVHLADDDGRPMHAVANGWYFYSGAAHEYERKTYHNEPSDTPHERAARTLRVDPSELPEGLSKEEFEAFAEGLADRWKADAEAALAVLEGRA